MKTATAFLVAVTVFASVFLESSAAPNNLFGALGSTLGTSFAEIGKSAGNAIAGVGAGVDKLFGKVGESLEGIGNKVGKDINTLIQFVGKILNDLKATLGEVTEAAAALGGEIGKKLEEALIKLLSTVEELIKLDEKYVKAVAEGDVDAVKKLEGLIKIVAEKLKAIVAGLVEILDQISEKVGNEIALVIETLKGILAKVADLVERILSKIAETTEVKYKEYVQKKIKISEAALADLLKAVELILPECTDVQKEDIAKFLEMFVSLVEGTHKELWEDAKANNPENRKKLMEKMSEAVVNTEADMNELKKTLGEAIQKIIEKYVKIILRDAQDVAIMMKKSS